MKGPSARETRLAALLCPLYFYRRFFAVNQVYRRSRTRLGVATGASSAFPPIERADHCPTLFVVVEYHSLSARCCVICWLAPTGCCAFRGWRILLGVDLLFFVFVLLLLLFFIGGPSNLRDRLRHRTEEHGLAPWLRTTSYFRLRQRHTGIG